MEVNKEANGDRRGQKSERSAGAGQAEGLDRQLPDKASARRAECGAKAEFMAARMHSGQHQAGDVAARDQEYQKHGGQEDEERIPRLAGDFSLERADDGRRAAKELGAQLLCTREDGGDLGFRSRGGHSWFEQPDGSA